MALGWSLCIYVFVCSLSHAAIVGVCTGGAAAGVVTLVINGGGVDTNASVICWLQ